MSFTSTEVIICGFAQLSKRDKSHTSGIPEHRFCSTEDKSVEGECWLELFKPASTDLQERWSLSIGSRPIQRLDPGTILRYLPSSRLTITMALAINQPSSPFSLSTC